MSESFDTINAPQFVDFSSRVLEEGNPDAYFEIDHENVKTSYSVIKYEEDVFYSPTCNTPAVRDHTETQIISISDESYEDEGDYRPRRSMSVGDLNLLEQHTKQSDVDQMCIDIQYVSLKRKTNRSQERIVCPSKSAVNKKVVPNSVSKYKGGSLKNIYKNKSRSNATLNSTGSSCTGSLKRAPSKEYLNKLAQPKYKSNENVSGQHTLAELVRQFQSKTPERFHSQPKAYQPDGIFFVGKPTVPHSPTLLTKKRLRPVHYLNKEEREEAEFQEAQRYKFKIKAHPIKKTVLSGPIKPVQPIERRPLTVPEPFNLTKPVKRASIEKESSFEFHAKPVPKSVLEPPKLKEFPKQITVPETPSFVRRRAKEMQNVQEEDKENKDKKETKPALTKTIPEPFSFESRDKQLLKKKEMFIQKVFEEEKKAREFHARPIPKTLFPSPGKTSSNLSNRRGSGSSSGCSSKHTKSDDNLSTITQFKAKPPTVLYKEPFIPKKEDRPFLETTAFYLNTEQRAKEREEFERYKKEKEEKVTLLRQQEEEEEKRLEEEERARLRKQAEVKAQPIRKYKDVHIVPSYKVTEPITPKFHTDRLRKHFNS